MTLPNFLNGFEIDNKQSLDCFNNLGLPTKKNENWHYLDMSKQFAGVVYNKQVNDNVKVVDNFENSVKISITNGNINIADKLPKGLNITVGDFKFSESLLNEDKHAFLSLNNAVKTDTIKIDVTEDVAELIHIEYFNDADNLAVFTKVIVNVASGKRAHLIETFKSTDKSEIFVNTAMEIFVESGATLLHYKSQQDLAKIKLTAYTKAYMYEDSIYSQSSLWLNNLISRNEVEIDMLGSNGQSWVQGIYITRYENIVDNTVRINHLAPNCESSQLFKGVLNEKSQAIFQGKIYVDKDAQKTDGYQMHRSILLSDDAQVNGKPELEIYADDVKCSHGSSTGEINEEQLFYLTSRGVEDELARKLLLEAFLTEVFDTVEVEQVKDYFQDETIKVMETIL
ncbi:MAG: Fe-S cluster assembly protein SufD [Alphaproteobacteria bacterium]